jgi:hypothetical protein
VKLLLCHRLKVIIQTVTTDFTVGVSTIQLRELVTNVLSKLRTGIVTMAATKRIVISPAVFNNGLKYVKYLKQILRKFIYYKLYILSNIKL